MIERVDEEIELPSIYYAHHRKVVVRDGMLIAVTPFINVEDGYRNLDAATNGAVTRYELREDIFGPPPKRRGAA